MSGRSVSQPFLKERLACEQIPYTAMVSERIVKTAQGHYVQAFELGGASFECAESATLNNWHERLNILWRNLASPHVALWTHLIRDRDRCYPEGEFTQPFARALNGRYRARVANETLMSNRLFLAVVYRPGTGTTERLALKTLSRARDNEAAAELADSIEACRKLGEHVQASLDRYDPQPLDLVEEGGRPSSKLLAYLALLVNGERQTIPLPRGPLNEALATSRLRFGSEVLEYRTPTRTRWGAMLGLKEYPSPTVPGLLNALLAAPFPMVLTQSFTFLSKDAAQTLLERQFLRLRNAGDFAVSQSEALKVALDGLTGGEFVMGEHHLSLQVLTDFEDSTDPQAANLRLRHLNDDLALARTILGDTGATVAREDLALEAAFWAQLPGCFALRPRRAPITSRNFAALVPWHNYPTGRVEGNHWGEATTMLVTHAASPYHFSLHASDPSDPDGGSRKDTGHTFVCGPTGSGKTVFVAFLIAMLTKHGASQVIFDKDRGLEILVHALGGTYRPLKLGAPTGCNPLQLETSPTNVEFLRGWLGRLAHQQSERGASRRVEEDLDQALRGTLALPRELRRLSRLLEFLDATDPEGPHARLSPWCESAGGEYAWVFDQARDELAETVQESSLLGFDVTEFLEHELVRAPLTMYLFHLVRSRLDGRRFVCWMDEFWRLLEDPAFERFAKDGPKTWRKLDAVMGLATQSASDVLGSPISRTILEQTPTKVFFPNADALQSDYVDGLGLTHREFQLIKEEIEPGSRQFLVKQGRHSVVCRLDLKGFDLELTVMSGRARNVALVEQLRREWGATPAQWLPALDAELKRTKGSS
ncbi:MAG: Type IV secretion system protein virB4 [Steroidobacteraceae bacterium]|nr:Type IV secretion system protein virB4 [Steroidobacteraceae bacterium]